MKKFVYAFLVIVFCFVSMSMSKTQIHYDFGKEDFVLHDRKNKVFVEVNETIEEIKRKLGESQEIKRVKPNSDLYVLVYDNILIQYEASDKKAYWIRAITPDFQTRRGVKVGDTIDKVYELYTKEEIESAGKFGNSDEQYIYLKLALPRIGWKEPVIRLFFIHNGEKITRIELDYSEW